jgi:hypothetical protein
VRGTSRRLLATSIALALLIPLAACSASAPSPADALDAALRAAGVAVFDREGGTTVNGVSEPNFAVVERHVDLMLDQASMGDGVRLGDLDALTSEPDVPPPSALIGAWVILEESEAARYAAEVIGPVDWEASSADVVVPHSVLVLFAADIADQLPRSDVAGPDGIRSTSVAVARPATDLDNDACSAITGFVTKALDWLFERLVQGGNAVIGAVAQGLSPFFQLLWTTAISLVKNVINTVAQRLTAEVFAPLQKILAVVGTVAAVASYFRPPPTVEVRVADRIRHYAIDGATETDRVRVRVVVPEWDPLLARCAELAGVILPSLSPPKLPLAWDLADPDGAIVPPSPLPARLDRSGRAEFTYTIASETREEHERGQETLAVVIVGASVKRSDGPELVGLLQNVIAGAAPAFASALVRDLFDSFIAPTINTLTEQLQAMLGVSRGTGVIAFSHHTLSTTTTTAPKRRRPPARPPDPPCRGCMASDGDPHIVTADKVDVSFQAAGEFLALRDDTDGLTIQVRQEPVRGLPLANNTAVAAQVGDARVTYTGAADGSVEIRVDGEPVTPRGGGVALAGGGSIAFAGGGASATRTEWSDGTALSVSTLAQDPGDAPLMRIRVEPAEQRRGRLSGLFGTWNDDPSDDLTTRTGRVLVDPTPDEVHETWGESWRISEDESLFDYADGESTASFTDRSFPGEYRSVDDLDPAGAESARRACLDGGVTDASLLENCTMDVAALGTDLVAVHADVQTEVVGDASLIALPTIDDPVAPVDTLPDDAVFSVRVSDALTDELRPGDRRRYSIVAPPPGVAYALDPGVGCDRASDLVAAWYPSGAQDTANERIELGSPCSGVRTSFPDDVPGDWILVIESPGDAATAGRFEVSIEPAAVPSDEETVDGTLDDGDRADKPFVPALRVDAYRLAVPPSTEVVLDDCELEGSVFFEHWVDGVVSAVWTECSDVAFTAGDDDWIQIHAVGADAAGYGFTLRASR